MPEVVQIPGRVLDAVVAHAEAELPNECCGLLIGSALTIHDAVPARNLAASPTSYLIDPEVHFAAIRAARVSGFSVVGAYHSHPESPATPSARDMAEASFPEFVYLIVSLAAGDARNQVCAYRLTDGRVTPLPIMTISRGTDRRP
jgi:[CysO sulfur-carrier protein]-S-L-cysteine hydrolase